MPRGLLSLLSVGLFVTVANAQSFVNWETPQVHPLDMTPDGSKLLAVNTADNRLEVFSIMGNGLAHTGSIPVGLDPVSVRARTNTEVWVINHISDSFSIVDLAAMNVVTTISTGDEPTDVVFAGSPQRAFVCLSQLNQINVYDPTNLAAAPGLLHIQGEDPRALATDGTTVYAAIFESGNRTTILPQTVVSSTINPYPGDANPPPNAGTLFDPPIGGGLPTPPDVSLIVKKNESGQWVDDNNGDWTPAVVWDLHDHDVAVIDANTLAISYVNGLMNANMALAVTPAGAVTVVGTDAINEIRFEPNVQGIFVRVIVAGFPAGGGAPTTLDLNPHLDYSAAIVDQSTRDQSIGDPRGVAWSADGQQGYITGMGSNNLAVIDAALNRLDLVEVGQGPTGVLVDDPHARVYVLNRFEGSVSIVDEDTLTESSVVSFYDPTPPVIKIGRPHLYDTHKTSGLGQAACASCHIDGRMDQLAWDLGNPAGQVKDFNQVCNGGIPGGGVCEDWHPMKGPMATQTLIGISGTEPLHWRGDREDLAAFNPAFINLMGDDAELTDEEMQQFTDFVATLTPPPNPFRNFNGTLPTTFSNGGNPVDGSFRFNSIALDGGLVTCAQCHALPSGTNGGVISGNLLQETQSFKIPQLRNMYEKTGFENNLGSVNNRGFGFVHDGSIDTLFQFLLFPGFTFPAGATGTQQRKNVEAFLMCFATDTHAAVGEQTTVIDGATAPAPQITLLNDMLSLANSNVVGVVVKGLQNGEQRGYAYIGSNQYQSDREAETISHADLLAGATPGEELTWTVVPEGTETRIGIDRDEDGYFDADEVDAGSDPADPNSIPAPCIADLSDDGVVNASDLALLLGAWGPNPGHPADLNGDGVVNASDLALLLGAWGACP